MAKAMKDFLYHFGLKFRIYPDYEQRRIIKTNSDVSRFVYNEMVYINLELWKFGNPKIYIKGVNERISELSNLKNSTGALKDKYFFCVIKMLIRWRLTMRRKIIKQRGNCIEKFIRTAHRNFTEKLILKVIKQIRITQRKKHI